MSNDAERVDESMARLDPKRLGEFCSYCSGFVPGVESVPGVEVRHVPCVDLEGIAQRMHAECVTKIEAEMAERREWEQWEYENDREQAHYADLLDEERRQRERELEIREDEWNWRSSD